MKTTLKGLLITILFLFNLNSFIWGQNIVDSNFPKIIYLLEGNDKKEIVIPVTEQSNFIVFQISASVIEGEIGIEIYNPAGERLKNSTVGFGSQLNPDKKIKSVLAFLPYKNPMKGNWIIKITCKNAKGSFITNNFEKLYPENQMSKTIAGTITYESKKPLWGAIVLVKGTRIGATTDKSGNFSLKVPDNAEYLLFYDEGMKTQEVKIGEQTKFAIDLYRQ
jgi:hypothetical protein